MAGFTILVASAPALGQQVGPYVPADVGAPAEGAPGVEAPLPPQGKAWVIVPSIGAQAIITDNVRQSSTGAQADLISILEPEISITGDTARFKGNLDVSGQFQRYIKASDLDHEALNLFGTGEATIFPDLLFFDGRASSSQANVNGGQGFTNSNFIPNSQRTQVLAASGGPVLRTDIGTLAHAELMYQFSITHFSNNTAIAGTPGLSDTTQNEGRLTLGTGEDFGRLSSTLVVDALRSSGGGTGSSQTDKRAEIDNNYALTRNVSLIAQLGYEDQTFPGSTVGNIKGPILQGGAAYTPNPDTSVQLLYGRRQGNTDFSGQLRFAVTAATKVNISYSQSTETTQQAILQGLGSAGRGPGGTIINPVTGLPITVVNPNFPLVNDIFRTRMLQGGVTSTLGRNTFTVTAFREERTSLAGVTADNGTSSGGSFQWSREMSPRMTGTMLLGYATDSGGSGATINASLGITYVFSEALNGGVRYDYIRGTGGVALNGTGTGGTTFTQNALTLSLTKSF